MIYFVGEETAGADKVLRMQKGSYMWSFHKVKTEVSVFRTQLEEV